MQLTSGTLNTNTTGRARAAQWFSVIALSVVSIAASGASAEPVLELEIGGQTRHFSRDALLARPDVASVQIAADVAYGRTMSFRAVPLAGLLEGLRMPADSVIEAIALDGFAAQLPLEIVTNTDSSKAVAWLAIEPGDARWPDLPGKTASAGPFYIVWSGAAALTIRSEQWPYQVAKLKTQPSPVARWPMLGVDPTLSPTHAVRRGQALFVMQCLPCHTLNGAGSSTVGPDMNKPMSPTQYLTRSGLHALIRDPRAVRSWPGQTMPGFSSDQMSDLDIESVIEYLEHMATRRVSQ